MIVDGDGSAATITGNTITGVGQTDQIAQNGIQISRIAKATVSGNIVSGNAYTGDDKSTGILLYSNLGDVIVSGNTFRGNDFGISADSVVSAAGPVTVSGNTVSGGDRGITLSGSTGMLVEKNTVSGAGAFGVEADQASHANVLRGNDAKGTSGDGHFDCRDSRREARLQGLRTPGRTTPAIPPRRRQSAQWRRRNRRSRHRDRRRRARSRSIRPR